jgi:hypothetical protein
LEPISRYDVQPTINEFTPTVTTPVAHGYQYDPATYNNNHQNDPTTPYNYETERTASSFSGHSDQTDVPPVKSSACAIL